MLSDLPLNFINQTMYFFDVYNAAIAAECWSQKIKLQWMGTSWGPSAGFGKNVFSEEHIVLSVLSEEPASKPSNRAGPVNFKGKEKYFSEQNEND